MMVPYICMFIVLFGIGQAIRIAMQWSGPRPIDPREI
jgi:hypothetical protein